MGDGHGLFWTLFTSAMIFNGGSIFFLGGLAGGGGGCTGWQASSSTNDWKLILILVLGNRNTHLKLSH